VRPYLLWPILTTWEFLFQLRIASLLITLRKARKVWRYTYANFDMADIMISEIDWDAVFSSKDIDVCWENWQSIFLSVMDNCIPHSVLKPRKNLPWLTKEIIQAMIRRNSLFHAAHETCNDSTLNKYKIERNKVVSLLRIAKAAYFQKLGSSNSKEFSGINTGFFRRGGKFSHMAPYPN
jgi:hypothetical protein